MSNPPPQPIDYTKTPALVDAARYVRDHLFGHRLSHRLGFDIEKVLSKHGWAVGSHVWRPALDVVPDQNADFDFVCVDDSRLNIVKAAVGHLFDETTNSFGSVRYVFKNTAVVAMDLWRLPDNVSIAEHIKSFPERWQGVAYAIGAPVDLALVRVTHDQPTNVRPAPTMSAKHQTSSRYPGAASPFSLPFQTIIPPQIRSLKPVSDDGITWTWPVFWK